MREAFGPYRMAGRTLAAALLATVSGVTVLIVPLALDDEIPVVPRTLLVLVFSGAAGLALWAFASSTRADADGLELRLLWKRRRIPWPQVQDIRVESSAELEAMGAGASTVVYDASGRRRTLPYLDHRNLSARGFDVVNEVEAMRAVWQRHRGPDWTPNPVVVANIRDRELHGDPIVRTALAAVVGAFAAVALVLGGLFLDVDDWGAPWSWPFGPKMLVVAPVAAAGYSLIRRLSRRRRLFAAARAAASAAVHAGTEPPGPSDTSELAFRVTPGGIVLGVAVSPDGTRVAVVSMVDTSAPNIVSEYDPADPGVPLRTWSVDGPWVTDVLHLGDAIVIRVEEFMGGTRLVRLAGESPETFGGGVPVGSLRHVPGGFVAVAGDDLLAFGTATDDDLRPMPLAGVWRGTDAWTLATDPAAGLIALGGRELVVLDARTGALVAHASPPRRRDRVGDVVFAGDGRIVTQLGSPDRGGFHHTLASWRLDGTTLTCQNTAPITTWGRSWPAGIPALGAIATVAFGAEPHLGGAPRYFDATTLTPVGAPPGLDRVTAMPSSPFPGLLPMICRRDPDAEHDDTAELHRMR